MVKDPIQFQLIYDLSDLTHCSLVVQIKDIPWEFLLQVLKPSVREILREMLLSVQHCIICVCIL